MKERILSNLQIPFQTFNMNNFKVNKNKKYVLVCQRGITSYKAATMLKNKFPELNVFSLTGGISSYER